jgi:hypothetical protein
MSRTWEQNRTAINQLWPQCQWTDEERRLWSDDLASVDQDVLYDAARNVKRNNDTLYPQLKWFRDEYRSLKRLKDVRQNLGRRGWTSLPNWTNGPRLT